MTREEAIEVLAQDLPCETDEDLSEAMTMAIKSLEAWGKVRAVIKKLTDDEWNKKVGSVSQGLEDALEIIDNHLSEVSE